MNASTLESGGFANAVIDALASHICVVDQTAMIVAVNRAWKNFASDNPPASRGTPVSRGTGVGTHYLNVCRNASGPGSEEADRFGDGIERVLSGRADHFELEYPCHSPTENRWFLGSVTPLGLPNGGAVISHIAITDRKVLETELLRQAETDVVTGLPNRRYFLKAAALEIARVKRFGSAAATMMIDLDHFKSVNDTHGHQAGDDVLRQFAQTCLGRLREIDIFARIGGEEFIALLPGTDEAAAVGVAEKLRLAVKETPTENAANGMPIHVTASFGVTAVRAEDSGIAASIARADKALFDAKRTGRDRVMHFVPDPPSADTSRA